MFVFDITQNSYEEEEEEDEEDCLNSAHIPFSCFFYLGNKGKGKKKIFGVEGLFWFLFFVFVFVWLEMARVTDASASIMLTSGASGRISALFSLRALMSLVVLVKALLLFLLVPFRGRRGSVDKAKDEKQEVASSSVRKAPVVRVPATVPWKCGAAVDQDVATRRALAIGRVVQEGGGGEKSVREFSFMVTCRGDTLFTQSWTPLRGDIRYFVL